MKFNSRFNRYLDGKVCRLCGSANRRRMHIAVTINEISDFKDYNNITYCDECNKPTVNHFFVLGNIYYELFEHVYFSIKNELHHSAYDAKELGSIILIYDDIIYPIPGGSVQKMREQCLTKKYADWSKEISYSFYDTLKKIAFKKLGGF